MIETFSGRWLLIRVDDEEENGSLVGLELDDCQASFKTHFEKAIGVECGTISLALTGGQTIAVKGWWRDPT
jgi:hypothetical protein